MHSQLQLRSGGSLCTWRADELDLLVRHHRRRRPLIYCTINSRDDFRNSQQGSVCTEGGPVGAALVPPGAGGGGPLGRGVSAGIDSRLSSSSWLSASCCFVYSIDT